MGRPAARLSDDTLHWPGRIVTGSFNVLICGMPAARILVDFHVCLMHGGGLVLGPGAPTVLINGLPAAVMGDVALCVTGPPNLITGGCQNVLLAAPPLPAWLTDLIRALGPPDLFYTIVGTICPLAPLIMELAQGKSLSDVTWSVSVIALNTNLVGYMTVAVAGVAAAAAVAVAAVAVVWFAVVKAEAANVRKTPRTDLASGKSLFERIAGGDVVQTSPGGGYYAPMYFL